MDGIHQYLCNKKSLKSMKSILIIFLSLLSLSSYKSQSVPQFLGTQYVDSGAMGKDQLDSWKYKGHIFVTTTPGTSRPLVRSDIYIADNKELLPIKNNQFFGKNAPYISNQINTKLKAQFEIDKKENPLCFDEFYIAGINEVSICVDKEYMYFTMVWDESYLVNANVQCWYPSTTIKMKLTDIENLIVSK